MFLAADNCNISWSFATDCETKYMKRNQLLLTIFFFCVAAALTQHLSGQSTSGEGLTIPSLKGNIVDDQSRPLTGASVVLKKKSDSAVVKIEVTDKEGNFAFEKVNAGTYFLNVSFVGYAQHFSKTFEVSESSQHTLPSIKLSKNTVDLKAVEVVSTLR